MLELGRHMCFGCLNSATCAEHALLWSVCSVLLELSLQPLQGCRHSVLWMRRTAVGALLGATCRCTRQCTRRPACALLLLSSLLVLHERSDRAMIYDDRLFVAHVNVRLS